jgi:hypothetical protein
MDSCGTSEEHYLRTKSSTATQRYRMTARRCGIVKNDWQTQILQWSGTLGTELTLTSIEPGKHSMRIVTPQDATEAAAAKSAISSVQIGNTAQTSEQLAEQAALLSIESSKKSISASKVAVVAGVVATATLCSVM